MQAANHTLVRNRIGLALLDKMTEAILAGSTLQLIVVLPFHMVIPRWGSAAHSSLMPSPLTLLLRLSNCVVDVQWVQEGDVVDDASVKAVLHYQLGTLFRDTLDQPCFVSQVAAAAARLLCSCDCLTRCCCLSHC